MATATEARTAGEYLGAWGEATVSFLDHLLPLALGLGVPALMIGVAGHHLLDADMDLWGWLFFRVVADFLLVVMGLGAGLWMSRRASFFQPSLGEVAIAVAGGESRILWAALAVALVIYPSMYPGLALLAVVPLLLLARPHRWLEGQGRLWGGGSGRAFVAALPLLLLGWFMHWAFLFWEVWSVEEGTALMMGLEQVVRVLFSCWAWTVLFRLFRIEEGE